MPFLDSHCPLLFFVCVFILFLVLFSDMFLVFLILPCHVLETRIVGGLVVLLVSENASYDFLQGGCDALLHWLDGRSLTACARNIGSQQSQLLD